ncbi:MAG: Na+/H+ antiporter NhaA, partial [Rhodospirillaceae bacterium]|nr:Na+/H+ antiporter NhaA [Rhodospirillaceae bacterium]
MTKALARLPKAPADKIAAPIARFLHLEAMGGLVLLCCTLLALGLSNSPLSERFLGFWSMYVGIHIGGVDFSRSLQHWINDGLMTLFFFVIALELKRELVLGELRSPKMAALPLAAAIGGMAVPALVFLLIAGDGAGAHGWGTVMATDTAFVIG